MTQFNRTLALSIAAFGLMAAPAFAQTTEAVKDKAVDMAKDKAVDMAKDKAKDMAADAMKSETAGDMMVKGAEGIAKDKMKHTATDMAKDHAIDKAKDMAKKEMGKKGTMGEAIMETGDVTRAPVVMQKPVSAPVVATPVETVQIACPSGTTAQPDGTCMITGDYKGQ